RKILFKKLRPVDDIDFATTIDVILAGLKVKYVQDAVAWDDAPGTLKTELNGRIRSSKRLVGTLSRWGTFNWFYHPLYSWTLFSHKLLRWSSPFFILTCFFANLFLLGHPLYNLSLFLMGVAVIFTIAGSLEHFAFKVKRIPFASVFFSFFMANLGFFIGFIKIVTGRIPIKYKVIEE
ncbi:MAG: hypothetical protein GY729_14435, partial [Desulfobacteraceae bacterium]|nr:hypothetical protein [Desulfobacteraceae bacterium]